MTLTDPKLELEFLGNDLEAGHSTSQTLTDTAIVRHAITFKEQRFNGLKSSSDTVSLQLRRKCSAVEDIISTEGDIKAVLSDGDTPLFTGFVSTNFSWAVTDHGDQALNITLESMGTRLFNKAFIETGKYFFDCPAATAIYTIVHPLGITIREGDERKLLQNVQKDVDAGTTCRELIDQLFYECNAVYWFNEKGEICIQAITADTTDAPVYDSAKLRMKDKKVVNLSKKIRTYKGARVAYDELGTARDYLIYRNTTNASATRICNLELPAGDYYDGGEIYSAAEWSEAMADEFREPTLISAVNAASESSIVGSGKIVNITNLTQNVLKDAEITFSAEAVGGPYFKLLAHNTAITSKTIWRMDLSADITYVKSHGVIRTQIDGSADGKSTLEEELSWIHDKDNASKHANLLAQYHKYASSTYTFYCNESINLGTVIKLNDDVYSGLEVYVLVTARQYSDKEDTYTYTAVGVTTFDLTEDAYHGTTEPAKQSGAQGPAGEPGATAEVQYAIGDSIINPPGDAMQWGSADMLWNADTMYWNTGTWEDSVPTPERGKYIWMRTRVGDSPWQYTRLTGSTSWDAENLGICYTACPIESKEGLGLIVGDYFVAGAEFDDDVTYYAGYAYVYNGTNFEEMDLSREENASKALDLLGTLVSENAQIPSSVGSASMWQWTKNFVAQNAVIQNLFAEQITVLDEGCVHSGYYNDDGTVNLSASVSTTSAQMTATLDQDEWFEAVGNVGGAYSWIVDIDYHGTAHFDALYGNPLPGGYVTDLEDYGIYVDNENNASNGDIVTVTVVSTSSTGNGFWLGANGMLKCFSAQMDNISITGESFFQGAFDCDVIKTEAKKATYKNFSVSDTTALQGYYLAKALTDEGCIPGIKYPAEIYNVDSPVAFVSVKRKPIIGIDGTYIGEVGFYDKYNNPVNIAEYMTITKRYRTTETTETTCTAINTSSVRSDYYSNYNSYYCPSTFTVRMYTGGNALTVNIPNSPSGLTSGQMFRGPATTIDGVTCYPLYVVS